MHSACKEHRPLLSAVLEVGYREQFDVVSSWGFCQGFTFEDGVVVAVVGDVQEELVEHAEGVGRTMREVSDVVFSLKVEGE